VIGEEYLLALKERNESSLKRTAGIVVLLFALSCLFFGAFAYLRLPVEVEKSPLDHQNQFFTFLDSVSVETPNLTIVNTTRSGYREVSESLSYRGCQCYGYETRTLKSADGVKLQVATSLFAITSARLRGYQWCLPPIHDPWFHLGEMFIDGQLVRALEDRELRINLQSGMAPVLYAKWKNPGGGFTDAYTAWSTGQKWLVPFDQTSNTHCKIPNLSPQQIQDGIELLRVDIWATTDRPDDVVPVELIKHVLNVCDAKLPVTTMGY